MYTALGMVGVAVVGSATHRLPAQLPTTPTNAVGRYSSLGCISHTLPSGHCYMPNAYFLSIPARSCRQYDQANVLTAEVKARMKNGIVFGAHGDPRDFSPMHGYDRTPYNGRGGGGGGTPHTGGPTRTQIGSRQTGAGWVTCEHTDMVKPTKVVPTDKPT
jgi:hypothetical protein